MATSKEFLRTQGNEKLLPLAIGGDANAGDVLAERGNSLKDGMVTRTVLGSAIYGHPDIASEDIVQIQNGKITEVNGNPYP